MNLAQLRKAVELMEKYGDGSTQQLSSAVVVVRCGKVPNRNSYRWRFTLNGDGSIRFTEKPQIK